MIAFLTSLRHPETATNYTRVEELFGLCARSVCSQTHDDIRFLVVCNQIPNIGFDDPRIQYIKVDFPVPQKQEGQLISHAHYDLDKGLKIASGTWHSLEFSPKYLFIVDADDWLDHRIATYADANDSEAGFAVDRSYMVNFEEMTYKRRRGGAECFGSTICPSLPTMLATFPEILRYKTQPSYQDLIEGVDSRKLGHLIGRHRLARHCQNTGRAFKRFPFFAASWVVDNGENNLGPWEHSKNNRPINTDFLIKHGLHGNVFPTVTKHSRHLRESLAYAKETCRWIHKDLTSSTF